MRTTGAHERRAITHIVHITKIFPNVCSDIASFYAPALSRRYYTAGSTSHTQYGWWRPSRSRGTQRGTLPQRQRRGRESARGISAPNAAPQPPQPPTRARSARRARHSRIQLIYPEIIAGILQLLGGLIRNGAGGATMRGSRSSAGGRARRAAPRPQ